MNDRIAGELFIYCCVVKTGSKPVALMQIQNRYLEEAKMTVENTIGLKFYQNLFMKVGRQSIFINMIICLRS